MGNPTHWFSISLRFLFVDHPIRISIGLIIGTVLIGVEDYFSFVYADNIYHQALPKMGYIPTLACGLLIALFPLSVGLLPSRFRKRIVPESGLKVFDMLDEAKNRGWLSELQHKQAYNLAIKELTAKFINGDGEAGLRKDIAENAMLESRQTTGE